MLDLILTTDSNLASSITYLPGISDHSILQFNLFTSACTSNKARKQFLDYSKANFEAINNELAGFLDEYPLDFSERSVEVNWNLFKDKINSLITSFIPCRFIVSNVSSPWVNVKLKRLFNKKKRLFRTAKSSGCDKHWVAYKTAANAYKAAINEDKRIFFNVTLPSMLSNSIKQFWSVVNGPKRTDITLTGVGGIDIPREQCAFVLNDMFVKAFSSDAGSCFPMYPDYDFFPMDPLILDYDGIVKLIDNLKISSSCGIDNITPKFIKHTKIYISVYLVKIFEQSLSLGVLPSDWKIGKVVPLHKTGDKHSPLNYRPISLTSTPCKLLEHIIYSHLVNFLDSNYFFFRLHNMASANHCPVKLNF